MNNEYSVWLFFVGIALGAAAVWLALARLPRQADDMGPDERAAAADWISSTIAAHGGIAPVALVEQVLDLSAEYLSGSPGPVARTGTVITDPYPDADEDHERELRTLDTEEAQGRHEIAEPVEAAEPIEPAEPTFEDLERELAEAVAARHEGDGAAIDDDQPLESATRRYTSRGEPDDGDLVFGRRLEEEPVVTEADERSSLDRAAFEIGGGAAAAERPRKRRNPREQRDPRSS